MKAQLVRWSARLERAALAFARSWVEDGVAASPAPLTAADALADGASSAEGAWSADGESPPDDWLRYVTARSQAPDGSRAYAPRATTEGAASSQPTRRPVRAARRLAAWARARVPLPGARPAERSAAPKTPPARAARETSVAPGHDGVPGGAGPRPTRSGAALPLAAAPVLGARPRTSPSLETPARPSPLEARPAPAPDALAAARPLEPGLPARPSPSSQPRSAERGELPRARLVQRAERELDVPWSPRGALPAPDAREEPAPRAASHRAAPAPSRPAPPAPPLQARVMADAARPPDVARRESLPPRSREPAAPAPLQRARARAGRVEVTELAPRLRLRATPEPAQAEPQARASDPSGARRAAEARARVSEREPARAGAQPNAASLRPSRAPTASPYAAVARGPAAPSRAASPTPSRALFERFPPPETDRSHEETDRSPGRKDTQSAALAVSLAAEATARDAHPPGRFPELPRRDGGAVAARATLDAWPELPSGPAEVAPAHPLERCDQLLREQLEA